MIVLSDINNDYSGKNWRSIDNTGKIFPATSSSRDTRVFRVYSQLNEAIDEEALQEALDKTILEYPLFQSVIRKGFFWYYLEKCDLRPIVRKEYKTPCSKMYIRDKKSLLIEVTYWNNRINFEVFHALTDGTGAVEFLRELTRNYLITIHEELPDIPLRDDFITENDYEDDSFKKFYDKDRKKAKGSSVKAYVMKGEKVEADNLNLYEKVYSTKSVIAKAREHGVSATVLLTAAFMSAINEERHKSDKKPIGIMIPVNLRKYFKSETMMNFFGWISPYHDFKKEGSDFEEVLVSLKERFSKDLASENVMRRMNELVKMEKNIAVRAIPLEFKIVALKLAAKFSCGDCTSVYSNVGAIHMPEEYGQYIERFGFFTNTPSMQLCTVSYKDEFTASFTSSFKSENIQRNFVRILKEQGIEPKDEPMDYPECKKEKSSGSLFVKIFTFVLVAMGLTSVCVNALTTTKVHWASYTLFAIVCLWITTIMGYYKRQNLLKNAVWQQIVITAMCVLWDMFTGWNKWSLEIVFPILNVVVLILIYVISMVRKLKINEYGIYYIMTSLIGLIPAIIGVTHMIDNRMFSYICADISVIHLVGLLIFKWKDVKNELKKKFHV